MAGQGVSSLDLGLVYRWLARRLVCVRICVKRQGAILTITIYGNKVGKRDPSQVIWKGNEVSAVFKKTLD